MAISLAEFVKQQNQPPKKRALVQKITNESVFLKRLRFIPVDGYTYNYGEMTTLGGIAFRTLNGDYPDEAKSVGVVNPKIETVSIFGGEVTTDRNMMGTPSGQSVRSSRVMAKVKNAGLFYDKYVIDGDPAVDGKQFYGLNARLTGDNVIYCGDNGGAITLDILDQALDFVVGSNNQKVIVCNKATRRAITRRIRESAGGMGKTDVAGQAMEYDGAPIEVIDEDGDASPILGEDETRGSSNVTCSLYIIRPGSDTDGEYVQGLVNSKMVEQEAQGVRGTQHIDLVEAGMGLAVFHHRAAIRVAGILPASNP